MSCNASYATGAAVRCQLTKLGLEGVGDLPKLFFCANTCAARYRGACLARPIGQRLIARVQEWATRLLGTDLRTGDAVHMSNSLDAHRYVYDGDGTVTALEYVHAASSAKIYVEGMGARTYECWPADLKRRDISTTGPVTRGMVRPSDEAPPPPPAEDDDRERAVASQAKRARIAEVATASEAQERASAEVLIQAADDRARAAEGRAATAESSEQRTQRMCERQVWRAASEAAAARAKLDSALGEVEALTLERDILEAKEGKTEAQQARLKKLNNRAAQCTPAVLGALKTERGQLRRELDECDARIAQLESNAESMTQTVATQAAEIAALQAQLQLAARPKIWVPVRCNDKGAGRGRPHDEMTRLLYGKLLTLRAPPSEIAEIVATCVYAILAEFPDEVKKMVLPTDAFARNMRPELGLMHQMISALTVGSGELVAWVNDASPSDGRELGALVARVKSIVNDKVVMRHCHTAGVYETPGATAAGGALAIKEKSFDR